MSKLGWRQIQLLEHAATGFGATADPDVAEPVAKSLERRGLVKYEGGSLRGTWYITDAGREALALSYYRPTRRPIRRAV